MGFLKLWLGCLAGVLILVSCTPSSDIKSELNDVVFEKYTLENGLDVVLHVDRSDPIVAINLAVHVGSARELPGRTGFAHLFEHLLFLDSENLGFAGLDEMNTRVGGEGTNGFTTNDMTQYFQAVPKDALEKVIWAEADKIGYFINTVTDSVLQKEKQVVKNEKRQRVDNVPYGHRWDLIKKALYDENHPYNWQVIGSLADLDGATLEDVKSFYKQWYVPNNVTVTLTGDFDVEQAKGWIEKYFGEIPGGETIKTASPQASGLSQTASLYYEDNFAAVPQLVLSWPTVPQYHADSYALDILMRYLTVGKRAPLNQVLIDEEKLTSQISAFHNSAEIAGESYIIINAKEGADLDGLMPALQSGLERFEQAGIPQTDLDTIKTGQEIAFYNNLQGALGKAIQLGQYNLFAGSPGYINEDIKHIQAVSRLDVTRVYEKYFKDKPYVALSIVPKGSAELALVGANLAAITTEEIVQGAEAEVTETQDLRDFARTASSFDRTVEPAFGPEFSLPTPNIWKAESAKGIAVNAIQSTEIPMVNFVLTLNAGQNYSPIEKPALAMLTARLMEKGTQGKTTAEFEYAVNGLGSRIRIQAGTTQTRITGRTLARNFERTMDLAREMLREPRWDAGEFDLLLAATIDSIETAEGNPNASSQREWAKILYPADHIFSNTSAGPKEKIANIALDDLKAFYAAHYSPIGASFNVVGDISPKRIQAALNDLEAGWDTPAPPPVTLAQAQMPEASKIYFYDVPGAKQSVLRFGYPSLSAVDKDYAAAEAMNYLLGNIYTSRLMTELRVNKGYTYGIRSGFNGGLDRGTFNVFSSVRANVTLEASQLIHDIIQSYGSTFSAEDLAVMKSALIKGQALGAETLAAKLAILNDISAFAYPDDYRAQNAAMIEAMTLDDIKRLTAAHLRTDAMYYLIVGDAKTQLARLEDLGYGAPILLNPTLE